METPRENRPELAGRSLPVIQGKFLLNEPMSNHTSFKIGGPADALAIPADSVDLQVLLRWADAQSVPLFVVGAGTNLLVSDKGIRGLVIELGPGFSAIRIQADKAVAGAAVRIPSLVRRTLGAGLAGLEGLAGIPGSVGGAVCMNAGTPAGAIRDALESVRAFTMSGDAVELDADELAFEYRNSAVREKGLLVTEAVFGLRPGDPSRIGEIVASIVAKRKNTQPVGIGTAGSIFKNPEGGFAGQILDAAGVKGMQVGGARVSSRHANWIENTGNATAQDVKELVARLQLLAKEQSGVDLELEIQLAGDWGQ